MRFLSEYEILMLRERYPQGTRIMLDNMIDPQAPPNGTCGTVVWVDDIGQIHMDWDNGSGLAINVDMDSFHVID